MICLDYFSVNFSFTTSCSLLGASSSQYICYVNALFLKWMNCDGCEIENKEILSQKNVVWVIGNSKSEKQLFFQKWINMVEEIGVHPNKIISVFLDESK